MLDDLNLRVCAVQFRTRHGYDVAENIDRRLEATKRAMQAAFELGASVVVNQIGRIPDEPGGAAWDLMLQALSDLGRFSHKAGAMLAAETGTEDGAAMRRLLDALPEGAIGVAFNPGNLLVNGFSPRDAMQQLSGDVTYVHAKDAVRDLARGRGLEVPLGRGSVDFPELLAMLEEKGYRGYVTIQREGADDPVFEVGQAVQYLRSL